MTKEQTLPCELETGYLFDASEDTELMTTDNEGVPFGPGWATHAGDAITARYARQEHAMPWLRHGRD